MKNRLIFVVAIVVLTACSGTTVVLVPDAKGKVGKVTVNTKAGSQELNQAGASTLASAADKAPNKVAVMTQQDINKRFGAALANEPAPPLHYIFEFGSGSADLSPDTKPKLLEVFKAIQARHSCDTSVIGHSDRTGDNVSNKDLSLKRARMVANELKLAGLQDSCMDIRYYGENDPVVPTADGVAEPRNRRVEVEVR
jgi:outer membrane protein OmpA-like peptidoglycan-associated protein